MSHSIKKKKFKVNKHYGSDGGGGKYKYISGKKGRIKNHSYLAKRAVKLTAIKG